jgi:multidrug resistance efflux pump
MNMSKETIKKSKLFIIVPLTLVLAVGAGVGIYFIWQGSNNLVTENARVTTTLFHIVPSMSGTLERFTIREGSLVRENEILGWLEGGESFRSPINGLVVRTFVEQGQAVSPQETLAVIADVNNLHIQANIEENYIARLHRGQSVIITVDALGRQQFNGYISDIGRVTDAALSGDVMSFTTGGTFTKVTQLLPVRIHFADDVDFSGLLSGLIGLNARVQIRLNDEVSTFNNLAEPQTAVLNNSINTRGIVESVERRYVYTILEHKVRQIYVEVGERVTAGQVLAILETDDTMLTVSYQQAESELRNARLELETSRVNHASLTMLYNSGGISRFDHRQAEDALAQAYNRYSDAQAMLNAAASGLARQSIIAPIDGVVTVVLAREGAVGLGLLFIVEDTENLKIITRFREYDIFRLDTGMVATISPDAALDTVYSGIISRINPTAINNELGDFVTASVAEFEAEIIVTSANSSLRIGMNTRLNIMLE